MSFYPSDIFLLNILLVPILLLFIKWAISGFSWWAVFLVSLPLSWFLINALLWIEPPDNGLAYPVNMLTGWIWLLPLCGICFLVEKLIFKAGKFSGVRRFGRVGSIALGMIVILFVAYGLLGRISASTAVKIADRELRKRGENPGKYEAPEFRNGHWIIPYENPIGWIIIDRNGRFLGGVG